MAKVKPEKLNDDFFIKNIERLPVALRIDSTNPLGLAAFLAAARTYIEQTAPGLTNWEMLKAYKDRGYVRISPVKGETAVPSGMENVAIYYTTVGGALTVTINEHLLKRAMDRAAAGKPSPASARSEARGPARSPKAPKPHQRAGGSAPTSGCTSMPAFWKSPTPWAASNTRTACRS